MIWRPAASVATLRQRAHLLGTARAFLSGRGLLEVETPCLVSHAVSDPHVQNVRLSLPGATPLFLHTSPEYHMKRLLAAGAPDIWQLGKVFRDGEAGVRHEPEFTLVEWYRHGFTLERMAAETCELLSALAASAESTGAAPELGTSLPVTFTYQELFQEALGIDPLSAGPAALKQCALEQLGARIDPVVNSQLGADSSLWLDLLMSHIVSERLSGIGVAIVTGYPAAQAALARIDPRDSRIAERFEVFCRGVEVANGYRELTDATEQRRRFGEDRARRARLGLPDVAPDPALLQALEHGLPDCAGVAVGFDRVLMVLLGLGTLQETLSFSRGGISE